MKYQILFSWKNKKNIPKCRLLKILLRVLSLQVHIMFLTHLSLADSTAKLFWLCPSLVERVWVKLFHDYSYTRNHVI